jgi:hypothetical protein
VWVRPGISTLDLLGAGFTLLTGQDGSVWRQAAAAMNVSVPVTVEPLDAEASKALDLDSGGALLVRPDGQVAARMRGSHALPDAVADLTGCRPRLRYAGEMRMAARSSGGPNTCGWRMQERISAPSTTRGPGRLK